MGSFGEVLSDIFGNLFGTSSILFAILAVIGVVVGYGIYQLGKYLNWW